MQRAFVAGCLSALLVGGLLAVGASGAGSKTVAVRDPAGDVRAGNPDLVRASLGRASDGRLRAALSLAHDLAPRDLAARSGPPGSICVRAWTLSEPPNSPPDYLVCVTVEVDRRTLRGSVLRERAGELPEHVAAASVSRRGSRTLVVRFSQSSIGRPAIVRFAAEATRAGCERSSCIDTAPDAPRTVKLQLRKVVARAGA